MKDLLAFLRLAENPRDRVAAFRVLQLLPGIGPGTARRALARLEAGDFDFAALNAVQPPAASAALWPALIELLSTLARCIIWAGQLEPVRAFYDPLLEELYEHPHARASPIWTSLAGSPRPIRRASGFSPSSPSIRRQRPATRQACRCATRTI